MPATQGRRFSRTPPGSQGSYDSAAGTYRDSQPPDSAQGARTDSQQRGRRDSQQERQQQQQQQQPPQQRQQRQQQEEYDDEYEDEYEEEEEEQPVAYGPGGTPLYLNPQPDNGSSYQGGSYQQDQYSDYQGSAGGTPQQYTDRQRYESEQRQQPRRSNLGPAR